MISTMKGLITACQNMETQDSLLVHDSQQLLHIKFVCQYCADFILYQFRNMLNEEAIGNNRLKVEQQQYWEKRQYIP